MWLCEILLTSFCLLCDGVLDHERSYARLLGSYSICCIYTCRRFDKRYWDDGRGKMDMKWNTGERWGRKGNLILGMVLMVLLAMGGAEGNPGPPVEQEKIA
jgi:hypothetical protein